MQEFSEIIGHVTTKQIIEKQLKNSAFPHASIFIGPKGVGKFSTAYVLAKQITSVSEIFVLTPDKEQLEAIREMTRFMSIRPASGSKRVCIVDNAEDLSVAAQNLLLKQVEEAPSYLHIIFVSTHPLLSTLESRCQSYYFGFLCVEDLTAIASMKKTAPETVAAAGGSVGMLELLDDEPEIVSRARKLASVTRRDYGLFYELAELESEELRQIFTCAVSLLRTNLTGDVQTLKQLQKLSVALYGIERNLNKKLNLQKLLLT